MTSQTEENYLKAIFKISERDNKASTNAISKEMRTSAASVTDMLKRLSEKKLVLYKSHKGATLSKAGNKIATDLIRKHRLWEVFLMEKLNFNWDEVHEIAEQLEHIQSGDLVNRLDQFLDFPKFDPHGDPIPDSNGVFAERNQHQLSQLKVGDNCIVVGVQEHSGEFLRFLNQINLNLGSKIKIKEIVEYDDSFRIQIDKKKEQTISSKVAQNLFVTLE